MNYVERIVARQQKQYHNDLYVDYRKVAEVIRLKKRDLEERLDWLIDNGYQYIKHTTLKSKIAPKTYSLSFNDHIIKLSYYDGNKHYWCTTNYHDDTKNVDTPNSFKMFKQMFRRRTGFRLLQAYGRTKQSFKVFCPKPLYYMSYSWQTCKWYYAISKEDYSSHYPWAATGKLPDANTMKEINAYVKPDEEYQFAFYPDTGHVAVYEEFDSHEWIKEIKTYSAAAILDKKFKANYSGSDKKTILMKASSESIEEEIRHFYDIKKNSAKDSTEYHDCKIFLLKFIGMLEQCNSKIYLSYPFAHLASVIKWRANIKMFKTLRTIGYKNILQVCVDGVIHAGEPIGSNKEELGSLNIECTNARFIQRGINQYILKNKVFKEVKHTGLDINVDSDNIMTWMASNKVNFIEYMKKNYQIEDLSKES